VTEAEKVEKPGSQVKIRGKWKFRSCSRSCLRIIRLSRLRNKRNGGVNLPKQSSNNPESPELDPQAKAEFMEEWGLEGGEMTDLQILRAIKNGQL